MKSGIPISLLLASTLRDASLMFRATIRPGLSQRPPTNQRKIRKARRQRHAAGLKHSFR